MKKTIAFIFSLVLCQALLSQSCDSNYLFKPGHEIEYSTFYNMGFGKPREVPKLILSVTSVTDSSGWKIATLIKKSIPSRSKVSFRREIKLRCDGERYLYDGSFLFIDTMSYKDLYIGNEKTDMMFTYYKGDAIPYPLVPTNGKQLPPYKFVILQNDIYLVADMDESGSIKSTNLTRDKFISSEFNFSDRKVEGPVDITTPAGTWKCFKIISKDPNAKGLYKGSYIIDYYAPGFGLVRTESYAAKRMSSYSVVSRIN